MASIFLCAYWVFTLWSNTVKLHLFTAVFFPLFLREREMDGVGESYIFCMQKLWCLLKDQKDKKFHILLRIQCGGLPLLVSCSGVGMRAPGCGQPLRAVSPGSPAVVFICNVCVWACMCSVRVGAGSLPPSGTTGPNSACQSWWPASLPTEPSFRLDLVFCL